MTKDIVKNLVFLISVIVLGRFTKDFYVLFLGFMGMIYAWQNRNGKALGIYLILPLLTQINPIIYPHSGFYSIISRVSMMLITLGFIMGSAGRARGHEKLPVLSILVYILFACISSATGYLPIVSYLKIINFLIFIFGLYFGVMNIHHHVEELKSVRSMMMAIAIFVIVGSALSRLVPGISYMSAIKIAFKTGDIGYAGAVVERSAGVSLFCGVTNHSQFLAPYLACVAGVVMCDMIFITKKPDKLHFGLLALVPILEFMTRSRTGLFSFAVMGAMSVFYALPKLRSRSTRLRRALKSAVVAGVVVVVAAAAVVEAKNNGITRWLRKSDVLGGYTEQSLTDAVMSSRQGLIGMAMADFHESPLLGKGFQVAFYSPMHLDENRISSYFSSPIEKGFVFTMVLGEGGIIGFAAFILFLIMFYSGCAKMRYYATATMFTVYLATNFSEATFFSPSGGGGAMWVTCVVGGFVIDIINKYGKSNNVVMIPFANPEEGIEEDGRLRRGIPRNPIAPERF